MVEVGGLAAARMGYGRGKFKAFQRRMKGFVDKPMDPGPTVVAASPSNFSNSASLEV